MILSVQDFFQPPFMAIELYYNDQRMHDVILAAAELDASILADMIVRDDEEGVILYGENLDFSGENDLVVESDYRAIYENMFAIHQLGGNDLQDFVPTPPHISTDLINVAVVSDVYKPQIETDNKPTLWVIENLSDFSDDWCGVIDPDAPIIFERYMGGHNVITESGNDEVTIWLGGNIIDTGSGNDIITLFHGDNIIDAGEGDDTIRLFGGKSDFIYNLGDGNDNLYGNADIIFGEGITLADLSIESYVIDIAGQGSINVEGYKGQSLIFSDGSSISYEDFTALFGHPSYNILEIDPPLGIDNYLYESEFGGSLVVCEFLAEANIPAV